MVDGIIVQYLVGLFLSATAFSQADAPARSIKVDFVRLVIGVALVVISIFDINLLNLA